MMTDESLIEFPCFFPVKIIGINSGMFLEEITVIVETHFPDPGHRDLRNTESKDGGYLSITAKVYVNSKNQLDDFYRAVSSHPDIKMVL